MRTGLVAKILSSVFPLCLILFSASSVFCGQGAAKSSTGNGFSISSSLERTECRLGDRNRLIVMVEFPDGYKPAGAVTPNWGKDIQIFSADISKPERIIGGRNRLRLEIRFAVFTTGDVTLSPVSFRFSRNAGETVECAMTPLTIRIKSLVTDKDEDIKDIKGPMTVPEGFKLWMLIIIVAVLAALAVVGILLIRKKKKAAVAESLSVQDPPHIEAYKALDNISRENLLAKGEYKKYYVALSEVIRRYLHRRFDIDTMEKTTREILAQMGKLELVREVRHHIKEFMDQGDLVKFARFVPTGSQTRESLETAYYIVDVTKEENIIAPSSSPAEEKHPAPVV
jgi:flagellar basal body-associated protein FliL